MIKKYYGNNGNFNFIFPKDKKTRHEAIADVLIDKNLGSFGPYEYDENDFYTYVPGEEVDILVNTKDEKILTMVPSSTTSIKSGLKEDIDDTYGDLETVSYDYVYARVAGSNVKDYTKLTAEDVIYVDKFEDKDDYVRINGKQYKDKKTDDWLILSGEERVTVRDIEVGDILVEVEAEFIGDTNDKKPQNQTFYVVGVEEAEGELTKYVTESYEAEGNNPSEYKVVTVGGEEYVVYNDITGNTDRHATYVEDPEASKINPLDFYEIKNTTHKEKMKGEDVVLKLDPIFGKVVRVEFDGKINGENGSSSVKFFGITSLVQDDGSRSYSVTLENEEGEEDYTFASASVARKIINDLPGWLSLPRTTEENNGIENEIGAFVAVELNEDNEIEDMKFIAMANKDTEGEAINVNSKLGTETYGQDNDDKYKARKITKAKYDNNTMSLTDNSGNREVDLDRNVVVVTLSCDDNNSTSTHDDTYTATFETGLDTVDNLDGTDDVVVVYEDDGSTTPFATHVVLFDTTIDNELNEVGIIDSIDSQNIGKEDRYITIRDGENYQLDKDADITEAKKGDVIVYRIKENSKGDERLEVVSILTVGEVTENDSLTSYSKEEKHYVAKADDTKVKFDTDTEWTNLALEGKYADDYEDYMIVAVDIYDNEDGRTYTFGTPSKEEYSETMLVEDDRVFIDKDKKVYYIVSGIDGHDNFTPSEPTPGPSEDKKPGTQPAAPSDTLLGKTVRELQDNVQITETGTNGTIFGTLHYVTDFEQFSKDPYLQEGNYLALEFTEIAKNHKGWSFTFNQTTKDFDNDGTLILRITTDNISEPLIIKYEGEEIISYNLNELTLEQKPASSEEQILSEFVKGKTAKQLLAITGETESTINTDDLKNFLYTTPETQTTSVTISTEIAKLFNNLYAYDTDHVIKTISFNNNTYTWNTNNWKSTDEYLATTLSKYLLNKTSEDTPLELDFKLNNMDLKITITITK